MMVHPRFPAVLPHDRIRHVSPNQSGISPVPFAPTPISASTIRAIRVQNGPIKRSPGPAWPNQSRL